LVAEKIELARGIFDIVLSPIFNKNLPNRFLVATPSRVTRKTKQKIAIRNNMASVTAGEI
jgi:hypothetical protein